MSLLATARSCRPAIGPRKVKRKRPPGADFDIEIERVARKHHECGLCRALIVQGDRARYLVGVSNGEFWHFYGCHICN